MVDSNARLVEPARAADETGLVEKAVPFRFTVTWTSVFDTLETPRSAGSALLPIHERVRTIIAPAEALRETTEVTPSRPGEDPVLRSQKQPAPNSGVQWEMVVPRMVRSTPKAISPAETAATPSRSRAVLQQHPEPHRRSSSESLRAIQPAPPPVVAESVPGFCSVSPSLISRVRQTSLGLKLILASITISTGIAVPIWRHFSAARPAVTEIQTTTRSGGWSREPVTRIDAGFNRARELVVYRPSLKATDCRLEFNWRVNATGVGWVFRAKDTANYYAMRIKLLKPGPSPTLSVEHFTVYRGVEGAHGEKVLVLTRSDPVLHIRTDLAGPSFTVYIGSSAVDYWNDTRMSAGGLGFFEEWHQGSDVESVRMSFAPGTEIPHDGLHVYMNSSGGD